MKRYVNGWDRPRFIARNNGVVVFDYVLSFKYDALKEYHEVDAVKQKFIDGSKNYVGRYIDYEWRLFLTNWSEKSDLLKLKDIEMTLFNGYELTLYPHIDLMNRKFIVLVEPEKREIDIHLSHRGLADPPNKGYEISFVNKAAITAVDMGNPETDNQVEVISQESPIEIQTN